jgi:hypothetical protein
VTVLFSLLTTWEYRKALKAACKSQAMIGLCLAEGDDIVFATIQKVGLATVTYDAYSMQDFAWIATNTVSLLDVVTLNHSHVSLEKNRLMAMECDGTHQFEGEAGACHAKGDCHCGAGDEDFDNEYCG